MVDRGARAGARQDLEALKPDEIRNVVLVGPSSGGKTSLLETLLVRSGALNRAGNVADGTTTSDFEPAERTHGRSMALAVAPLVHRGVKVNVVDTPGYVDFVGELRAGLRAADCALFVVAANEPVDRVTTLLWRECADVGMPRAVVINRIDHPRATYEPVLTACQESFGPAVLPLCVPIRTDGAITGLLDLLSGTVSDYGAGSPQPRRRPATAAELAGAEPARAALIEGIIAESEDETLMDRYLGGAEIGRDTLVGDLEIAVLRGSFYPVLATSAETGVGIAELLELLTGAFPAPVERPLPLVTDLDGTPVGPLSCAVDGPMVGEVVRTTIDSFLGRVCLVRIFSGTLREDSIVHIGGHGLTDRGHQDHDSDERITHLQSPLGPTLRPVPFCVAGDICALTRLTDAETGDTVSDREAPLLVAAWEMPEPLMPVAVHGAARSDDDALAKNLGKIVAVDPTLRVERNAETHQLVLWCMGEAHAEVVLDRLRAQGVKLETVPVITPLRETFAAPTTARGRYVKQSGGHGQYAICEIEVDPLPRGAGFEFVNKIVGGVIPAHYIASVEKGVLAQMQRGVSAGFPVVDIRVTLVGGKTHSVDSSDAAFQAAGALALREAAAAGRIQLLEPVSAVTISVPDASVGSVMTDLSTRRGHMTGTTSVGEERTEVSAEIPDAELLRYAIELRALTAGSGWFRRSYLRHEPVPSNVAAAVGV